MTKNKTTIFLLALLITAFPGFAEETILLKNGDSLTGDILKETPEHVYFRSRAVGAVSLQKKDISKILSDKQIGALNEAIPAEGSVISGSQPPPMQVQEKSEPEAHWSGQTGLSLAMRESVKYNATGVTGTDKNETYRFYGDMGWDSNKNKLRWNWTYRYSRDEYEKQDDFLNITQRYTHDFRENYYATAKTMYQQDYRRQIDNEYLQTAQMGIKWLTLPDFEFATSAGGGYHQFDRISYNEATQQEEELNVTQPKFIFDESLRWQIINSLTLIQKYTHLGDLTDYHFVFTAGLENKLIHDIFLRLEYRLDRDTEVYYDDRGYYDKALLTSLLYKF